MLNKCTLSKLKLIKNHIYIHKFISNAKMLLFFRNDFIYQSDQKKLENYKMYTF